MGDLGAGVRRIDVGKRIQAVLWRVTGGPAVGEEAQVKRLGLELGVRAEQLKLVRISMCFESIANRMHPGER